MNYLAKTLPGNRPGISVFQHMRIVSLVARAIMALYPDWIRAIFFPPGAEILAGSHDIGKITPAFQEKLHRSLAGYTFNSLPELSNTSIADPEKEHLWGRHSNASALTLERLGLPEKACSVVGKHHGHWERAFNYLAGHESLGGEAWQRERERILEELKRSLQCDWPTAKLNGLIAPVLAGLTSVADWIGSGPDFAEGDDSEIRITAALHHAGFVHPAYVSDLTFEEVFPFPPNQMQRALAASCTGPGLYLVEAPMGMGKTEAALYAAYLALSQGRATGLYFALPTQLTSNKIYDRLLPFLRTILAPTHASAPAMLLHGMAFLEQTDMGEEGQPGKSWYNSLKRAILSPFGVGTLDQALLGALPDVRHSFVRTFGLLGKVVILDEIHSYDAYTSSLINKFLVNLKELRCTVFILSATLTAAKRREFLGAGHNSLAYPLLSAARIPIAESPLFERHNAVAHADNIALPTADKRTVFLHMSYPGSGLGEEARQRASAGQQVLWIENTIQGAQESFRLFQARSANDGYECGLLHSRFLQWRRQENEEHWTELYGKKSKERYTTGRILVGTQVLEQSLDIDADCLFTALCPIDMLFQRMGRLWRHDRARPPGAQADAFILLPNKEDAPLSATYFGVNGKVYAPYVLYRTMRTLSGLDSIRLPEGIRTYLEAVYQEQAEQGQAAVWLKDWQNRAALLDRLAKSAMSERSQRREDDDEFTQTRYSDMPTVSVLISRSIRREPDGVHFVFADEQELVLCNGEPSSPERKRLAGALMRQTVRVGEYQAPQGNLPSWLTTALNPYVYLGKRRPPLLRIAVMEPSGTLSSLDGQPANDTYELRYTNILGYEAHKRGTRHG